MRSEQPNQNPRQAASTVKLHIDRLVLHGFAPADRHRIAQSVQRELAQLMGENSALASLKEPLAIERADGGSFSVHADANPRATGTLIAQAIHQSLRRGAAVPATSPGVRAGAGTGDGKR